MAMAAICGWTRTAAPARADFGSRLCQAWEAEALRARGAGVRVLLLRTALVLAAHGGMLARLLPLFRLGLGGRLGDGQQWMPGSTSTTRWA
jgi:NAD dependent epimerase/dehydratase family enzyme